MTEHHQAHDWWQNCGHVVDAEITALDQKEDELAPLPESVRRIREQIGRLEMCHHKAERWVERIIEAVGTGHTGGGLGTRPQGKRHSVEGVWLDACQVLVAWCEGEPENVAGRHVGEKIAAELLTAIGEPTELKRWQVRCVERRIRSFVGWPEVAAQYIPLLEIGSGYVSAFRSDCPAEYGEEEHFWHATVQTMVHDERPREPEHELLHLASENLSLALAIDMLWPCNWNFEENLHTLLAAIGGQIELRAPLAVCARHVSRSPIRPRMITLCQELDDFDMGSEGLGGDTHEVGSAPAHMAVHRSWLIASLAKTIRLQLDIALRE